MKKIIYGLVILISFLVVIFIGLIKLFSYGIWKFIFDFFTGLIAGAWSEMPEPFRKEFPIYDFKGSRHYHRHVKHITVCKLSAKNIVEIGSYINISDISEVKKACADKNASSSDNLHYLLPGYFNRIGKKRSYYQDSSGDFFNRLDAEEFGKIAYIAMNHTMPEVRAEFSKLLKDIKEHFSNFDCSK